MDRHEDTSPSPASSLDREVLDILLESDLYLELPLRERQQLFKHIVSAYLNPSAGGTGFC